MLLNKGQIFGEEVLLVEGASYPLYSVRCKSITGEVLMISELEFVKKLKTNPRTLKVMKNNCHQKAIAMTELLMQDRTYFRLDHTVKELEKEAKIEARREANQ